MLQSDPPNERLQSYLDKLRKPQSKSQDKPTFKTDEDDEQSDETFNEVVDDVETVQKIFEEAVNDEDTGLSAAIASNAVRRVQQRHIKHEGKWLKVEDFPRAVGMNRSNFVKSLFDIRRDKVTMPLHLYTTAVWKEKLHIEHRNDLATLGKTSMEGEARWEDENYYKKWNWTNMWLDHAMDNWRKSTSGVDGWTWNGTTRMWTPKSMEDKALVQKCVKELDLYQYE